MYCSNCGKENSDQSLFCSFCGKSLSVPIIQTSDSIVIKTTPPEIQASKYGGFWVRFLALIIDSIILGVTGFIVGYIFSLMLSVLLGDLYSVETASVLGYLLGFFLNWLYFTILESSSMQATLGKKALRLRVTDEIGNRIGLGKSNARYWSKILSGLILFIGYLIAAFDGKKQSLHDKIAHTLIVKY